MKCHCCDKESVWGCEDCKGDFCGDHLVEYIPGREPVYLCPDCIRRRKHRKIFLKVLGLLVTLAVAAKLARIWHLR